MKFTFLRKLREPESGAGGAPAPAPSSAPAAAPAVAPSPVAVPDAGGVPAGQGQAPSSAPAVSSVPDASVDPAGFETWFDNASDEERIAFFDGPKETAEVVDPDVDPDAVSEDPEAPKEAPAAAESVELEDEGLTQEEFEKLPPRAQAALREAQELGAMVEANKAVLDPTFKEDLRVAFSDPVIARRLAEIQHGQDSIPTWLKGDFDEASMVDSFLSQVKEQDLDLSLNPDATKQHLQALVKSAVVDTVRRMEMKQDFERRENARIQEETKVLANGFANLTQEFVSLRSDKPLDSSDHPVETFRSQVLKDLESGRVSFEYVKENLPAMFAGFAQKGAGVKEIVAQREAKIRTNFIRNLTDAARQGAVTAAGAKPQANARPANALGIDEARYTADPTYRSSLLARAEETNNPKLWDELERLDKRN